MVGGKNEQLHWPTKFDFFKVFLTNFDLLITYSYLTTECEKIFTLSGHSLAYYYVKDNYYEGLLNKVESYNLMSNSNGFLENQHTIHILK